MVVDGKVLARGIRADVRRFFNERSLAPSITVLVAQHDLATTTFLGIKRRVATELGVSVSIRDCGASCTTESVIDEVRAAVRSSDGVIVQLPFPHQVDISRVFAEIPESHDVDVVGNEARVLFEKGTSRALPPVTGAIATICDTHHVSLSGTPAVVLGNGRLVGAPTATWLKNQGAVVTVLEKGSRNIKDIVRTADVLVLGTGSPHSVTKDMLKPGVAIFDAGTSEDGGKLVGDAHPSCEVIAGLFTPVPGGIGPVTVALIFGNLATLRYGYVRATSLAVDVPLET